MTEPGAHPSENIFVTTIRMATTADAAQIAAIYAPFCRHSHISFETEAPTQSEMEQRIAEGTRQLPWLVSERSGILLGYAYASPHRARAAYRWSVDVTAYIREENRGMGIGQALYRALLPILRLQGFYRAYAGIALPNAASIGLHEAMGFSALGVYRGVGYKAGAWRDVGHWELALQQQDGAPAVPLTVGAIIGSAEWQRALAAGQILLPDEN